MKNARGVVSVLSLLSVAILGGVPLTATAAVYDGWGQRMKITFAGYNKSETLTNFPALVVLGTNITGFLYNDFDSPSDGADLRFADSTESVPLNYEIERWDTNAIIAPTAIPGCQLWLKADDGAQTNVSGVVTNWLDQSGLVRHAAATGSPLLVTSAINGKPAVQMNGSGQYFGAVTLNAYSNSFHVFVVLKAGAKSAYHNIIDRSGGVDPMLWVDTGNKYEMGGGTGGGTKITSAASVGGWDIVHLCINSGASALFVDGRVQGVGTETVTNSSTYTLFNRSGGSTFTGEVAEVVCYSNTLTETQQHQIGAYLAGKYGMADTEYQAGKSYVWVQVPSLSGSSDHIYAYWGRATNAPPCTTNGATWSAGYAGVWHLGNPAVPVDASGNSRHGTNTGVTAATGRIGGGGFFNGSSRIVTTNSIGISGSATRTLSCWANISATPDPGGLLGWGNSESSGRLSYLTPSTGSGYAFSFWGYGQDRSSGVPSRDNVWHMVTATYDGANIRLYVDGVLRTSGANTLDTTNTPVFMGCPGSRSSYITGFLDELSIATVARSTNWIWASWSNQVFGSTFASNAPVEIASSNLMVRADSHSGLSTNGATLNGTLIRPGAVSNATVYVVWDSTDKNTNALTDWTHIEPLGTNWVCGAAFSTNITGLTAGSNVTYRCFATNSAGETHWSSAAVSFAVPYALVVRGTPADLGSPSPYGYGTNLVAPGTITNGVATPVSATSTSRIACAGWSASLLYGGSAVSNGVGAQAVLPLTNHTVLAWNWTNEWYLTVTNTTGGTNGVGAGWYTNATPVSLTAFPTGAYHFIGWSGDVPAGTGTNNPITVPMDQARTLRSQFSTSFSNFTLVVAGSPANHGRPQSLNYGTYATNILDGSWITNTVTTPTNATSTLRYACQGWTLAYTNGTYLTGDSGTQAVFQLDASKTLTWRWTNEYYLTVTAGTNGTATTGTNGWYTNGASVMISATGNTGYTFLQWSGNVPAGSQTSNPLTLAMDQVRSVQANFTPSVPAAETKVWTGTNRWTSWTNWSPVGMPGPEDAVIVGSGSVLLDGPTTVASLVVSDGATLVFTNWNSVLSASGDILVRTGATVTLPPAFTDLQISNNVYFACSNFTLETGGTINADYAGYQGGSYRSGYGPGSTNYDRGAAGHGGRGTTSGAGIWGGPEYGSTSAPVLPGSGGSGNYGATGGKGGGAVRIEARGSVCINGIITANGERLTTGAGNDGGGSGGSIYISCATFAGTNGFVRANGGTGSQGGGGGGRIAVLCTDDTAQAQLPRPSVNFSTMRGGGGSMSAELGTVYLSTDRLIPIAMTNFNGRLRGLPGWTLSFPQLAMTNSTLLLPEAMAAVALTVSNDFILNGSTLDVEGYAASRTPMTLNVGGNLVLTNTAKLYVYAGVTNSLTGTNGGWLGVTGNVSIATNCILYPTCHATNGGAVRIVANNVTIDAGGSVFADSRGYATGYGPGLSIARGGAGHGGPGGTAGGTEYGGPSYGSSNAPIEAGSGSNQRNGGGTVWINAAGTIRVNGTITANGTNGVNDNGASAGGSIYLTCATIAGASGGSMSANGGSTILTSGGGGGGRIAVYYASDQMGTNNVMANGGIHATLPSRNGTNGTVVWAQVAGGTYNLVVNGSPAEHGVPVPYDYGNNAVAQDASVSLSVDTPSDLANGCRYACIGWTLSNATSVVDSGTSNTASFLLSTNLFLTWHWTSEWYLASSANSNGVLQADHTGWYTNGTPVTLRANADSGYGFLQWSGSGVPVGQHTVNPLSFTMDRPRPLVAQFATTTPPSVRTWTGSGEWWSVTNWNPAGVPGRMESVSISSGATTLRDPITVAGVTVSNTGALRVESTGTLTVASSMVITGASAVVVVSNAMLACSNGLTVAAGGKLYAWGGVTDNPTNPACIITALGTLLVRSNSYVFPCSHPTNGGSAFFRVGNLVVEQGGWVNASSNGYAGAFGPGVGNVRGGGGHGGLGGDGVPGSELGGGMYGWSNAPVQPGSGGGSYGGGRSGGGVIWIEANGNATVDGNLTANGSAASHDVGAGAGGSIYLRCRRFLGGSSGFVEARGGDTSGTSGAGGGGRIAIYRVSDTFAGTLSTNSVRGGTNTLHFPARGGGYGTLVLEKLPAPGTVFIFR